MLKAEKEIIFRFDSDEKIWHIYSCHPRVWRRAEGKGHKPVKRHFKEGQEIARQYRVPADCFRYRFRAVDRPRRPAPKGAFKPKKRGKASRK
jgi:hypothetical protein